jgi:hypothetical protein
MGFLDSIAGNRIEKGWQCLIGDGHTLWFRPLEMEDSCLIERNKDKSIRIGWKHLYGNEYPCEGWKPGHISPSAVTFCHPRDVLLELYPGIVPDHEKPDSGRHKTMRVGDKTTRFLNDARMSDIRQWCADVGEQRRMKLIQKKPKSPNMDKIIMFLGIGFVMELLGILFIIGQRMGGHGFKL